MKTVKPIWRYTPVAKKAVKRVYGTVSNDEVESVKEKMAEILNPALEKAEARSVSIGIKGGKRKKK